MLWRSDSPSTPGIGSWNSYSPGSEMLKVPLTTIDQNCTSIGAEAARLAFRLIRSKQPMKPESILIPPTLVVRESSKRA